MGEGGKSSEVPDERLRARWTGRKIPEPGVFVVKYCVPSTAPSFLPREAKALLSSTPAKTPFLPRMLPTNLTTPCIPPGTSTVSPTSMSCPSAMLGEGDAPPVSALSEAWRAIELEKDRLGVLSAGRKFGRRRRGVLELPNIFGLSVRCCRCTRLCVSGLPCIFVDYRGSHMSRGGCSPTNQPSAASNPSSARATSLQLRLLPAAIEHRLQKYIKR